MRLPGFRFTIRQYMVGVAAITCLVVGGVEASRLMEWRGICLEVAEDHAAREREERQKLVGVAVARGKRPGDPLIPIIENLALSRLEFHVAMRSKWREAAARPWRSVPEDPEEPTDERIVKKFELGPLPYFKGEIPPKLSIPDAPAPD